VETNHIPRSLFGPGDRIYFDTRALVAGASGELPRSLSVDEAELEVLELAASKPVGTKGSGHFFLLS
jgi:hypothetical protein